MEKSFGRRLGKTAQQLDAIDAHFAVAQPGYTLGMVRWSGTVVFTRTLEGVQASAKGGQLVVHGGSVQSTLREIVEIEDVIALLNEDGRVYQLKNDRRSVHMWSKDVQVMQRLKKVIGGNYYRHGSGFVWMVSNRRTLEKIDKLTDLEVFGVLDRSE